MSPLSPVKKSSGLNQERNMHRLSTVYKPKQPKTVYKQIYGWNIFTGGSVIMDYGLIFGQKQWFKVKNALMMDLFLEFLASQDWWTGVVWIICGLLICFYQQFGLILTAPIHCRGSIGERMLYLSKSDKETNSSTSWMDWGWAHFHFWGEPFK